jgi:hypothetical protein
LRAVLMLVGGHFALDRGQARFVYIPYRGIV